MSARRIAVAGLGALLLLLGGLGERSDARTAQEPVDCDSLWPGKGFPADAEVDEGGNPTGTTDNPGVCVLMDEVGDVKVFYPASVYFDHIRKNFYDSLLLGPIRSAIRDSRDKFNGLPGGRRLGAVNVIFLDTLALGIKPSEREEETPYAETRWGGRRSPCPVVVYTRVITGMYGKVWSQLLPQTVAHELFHCYQVRNYWSRFTIPDAAWWREGTAEYFGNFVYPTYNEEYDFIPDLEQNEPGRTPVDLGLGCGTSACRGYENFLFFQFLANTIDNRGILNLIGSMPAVAGPGRQLDALARFPRMLVHFHAFARQYLNHAAGDPNNAVEDTGGGRIPVTPRIEDQVAISGARSPIETSTDPLVITRVRLTFAAGKHYFLRVRTEGAGRSAARPFGPSRRWRALPTEITPPCRQRVEYLILVTSTSPGYKVVIDVPKVESNPKCKPGEAHTPTPQQTEFRKGGCGQWEQSFPRLRRLPKDVHVKAKCHGEVVAVKYLAGCLLAFPRNSRQFCEFYRYAWADEWFGFCGRGASTAPGVTTCGRCIGANPSLDFWMSINPRAACG